MKIDLHAPEDWERLNDRLRSHFQRPSDESVKVYRGLGLSLFEVTQGVTQFLAHKRSLGIVKGTTPYFSHLLPYYLKEAYQIQQVDAYDPQNNWETWTQNLKKDTVLVLASEDHPVTGEIFDLDKLDALLNEKKVFFIRISHNPTHIHKKEIRPYSIHVQSLGEDLTLVFGGNKYKVPSLFSSTMPWPEEESFSKVTAVKDWEMNSQRVQEFEKSLDEFKFFKTSVPRSFDRSCLVFPGVSGDRMVENIKPFLGLSSLTTTESSLWSTHLCRWDSIKLFKSWWSQAPNQEVLRDMIIIGTKLLSKKDLDQELRTQYKKLLAEQSWSF